LILRLSLPDFFAALEDMTVGVENLPPNTKWETFTRAPDIGPAPVTHRDGPNRDASNNKAFAPIHTYHLGLFFDSPGAARRSDCPDDVTPFNGEHRAGIKALSTRNFPDKRGPLRECTATN